jgi:hypothetical protein
VTRRRAAETSAWFSSPPSTKLPSLSQAL